jgi:hypothetical protein
MSGTGLPSSYLNLASNTQTDVAFPTSHTGNELLKLSTSLWSYSSNNPNNSSVYGTTINMQTIDTITGPTGCYYAIRVLSDSNAVYYGNIKMFSVKYN